MNILAIETSCDETAAAVVRDGAEILSNVVVSQIDIFKEYGGVIPEVAARSHLEAMMPVVDKAFADAGMSKEEIDAIAVTNTPGLIGSLLIGTLTARMLAILWEKPLYAVHHLKSHIYSNWIAMDKNNPLLQEHVPGHSGQVLMSPETEDYSDPTFPLIALVVSGGHTQIIYMAEHNQFEIIGTTKDDAVGECFDKVAKILGLPYPGGPAIAAAAQKGDAGRYSLPHPKVEGLDFSFSGLKTAVLRAVQKELGVPIATPSWELAARLTEQQRNDFAASFQQTACEILVDKLKMALTTHQEARSVVLAGGVSANKHLRNMALKELQNASDGQSRQVYFPELKYAGDNAAMVGVAAYYEVISGVEPTDPYKLTLCPRKDIE